jgi:polyisoprenoid-binding protein YceI
VRAALAILAIGVGACGGAAPAAVASPSASAAAADVTSAPATERFEPEPADSKVTVRVREQLATLPSSSDAVLETSAISGVIAFTRDGRLTDATVLRVDLSKLQSNEARRDSYVKQITLETNAFPMAELRAVRTIGLPAPLPRAGEWRFRLVSELTIHGTTREVTWQVQGQRLGRILKATATTTLTFADFGLERPRVAIVLSVQNEIRLEVSLTAVQV